MAVVCLDTMVVAYATRAQNPSASTTTIAHAKQFIDFLDKQKVDVIIPAIVVAEVLSIVPPDDHSDVLTRFRHNFMVVDFNLEAASVLARLCYDSGIKALLKELKSDQGATHSRLKVDLQIMATAIVNNVSRIYTCDKPLMKLATGHIPAEDFRDIPLQSSLDFP